MKKKQIIEAETGLDHQPPTALELVEAVFNNEDYSPKLALQARVWVEVEVPHGKRQYGSDNYRTGIKRGQVVPWMFPVVDVRQSGRSNIALVCSKPSMHHEALTFMELKSKFLDAKVRKDDVVTAECSGLPVGDIVAVNVHQGRIPGEGRYYGGGQHVVVIKCIGSQEFTKSRDEGWLGAADIRESHMYTERQITEAISYWEKQLRARNYKELDEASYEESQNYRRSLEKEARYVVPAVQRAVKQNELPGTVKPVQGDWIDLLNAACAIAYYAQCNCPDQGLAEMADKIVQIGAGYMI